MARYRGAIDESDPPELHAVRAELRVTNPRRDGTATRPYRADRQDWDTEHVFLGDVLLHEGSQYGVADHVARWLYEHGYRAGAGPTTADKALDDYSRACGLPDHLIEAAARERDTRRRGVAGGQESP